MSSFWDYLVVTASNDRQASAYESQLRLRCAAGQLPQVGQAVVIADLDGKRIGSGASTLDCLVRVVNAERQKAQIPSEPVEHVLRRLRILIVHAGGDSRRLPAYGPAGKIFVPLPGDSRDGIPATLFDRLAPAFLNLPRHPSSRGQVIVAAGDALVLFDASKLELPPDGLTIVGCHATPEESSHHGVFCVDGQDQLRLYLQKPSVAVQTSLGAINAAGQSVLDIGVMSFDAAAGAALLAAFDIVDQPGGTLEWSPAIRGRILAKGIDLYREICCALGTGASLPHFIDSARTSGSKWTDDEFAAVFPGLRSIPVHVRVVPSCRFLHFGSTRQLVPSGEALQGSSQLSVNNEIGPDGRIEGPEYWVEGCRIEAPLQLAGGNVVIGVDVVEPLSLPLGACLDVLAGESVWFIRPHGVDDTFKHSAASGGTFCGCPILDWLEEAGAGPADIWNADVAPGDRTLWNARVFPATPEHADYRDWLWFFNPRQASADQKRAFLKNSRYSAAEVALLADQDAFHQRRIAISRALNP